MSHLVVVESPRLGLINRELADRHVAPLGEEPVDRVCVDRAVSDPLAALGPWSTGRLWFAPE